MSNIYTANYTPENVLLYFYEQGFKPVVMQRDKSVDGIVNSHPDMFMCKMGIGSNSPLIKANKSLIGRKYPDNIPYNGVCLDKYFIHNLKYTAPEVLKKAKSMGKTLIHVNQGYTKCNIVVVDGSSIITSDEGIVKTLINYPQIDVLQISPGHVCLPGYDTGFLGGASGRINDIVVFCGDLSAHPDYYAIVKFISQRGIRVKFFDNFPLLDVGSFIQSDF